MADAAKMVLSQDVEVYSLLGFAFGNIDFGSGVPFFHTRGVYAYVNLFRRDMDVFKNCCYSLLAAADSRF
ncbi:hypothetical protein EJB05_26701, partial [Eragrostis curvula]